MRAGLICPSQMKCQRRRFCVRQGLQRAMRVLPPGALDPAPMSGARGDRVRCQATLPDTQEALCAPAG